ncbi:MAG TPA: glycoside hydrolase family 2 protein, partial [Bacteroidia bacterium]|nr:glycoside hydrolase family 2 protein [Bacteroidia bacterium]
MRPGENKLRILFHAAPEYARKHVLKAGLRYPADNDSTSPFTRKAAVQYGWDFAPRMVTCGIRKKVHLRYWHNFIIRDVQVIQQQLSTERADMIAKITVESAAPDSAYIALESFHIGFHAPLGKGITEFNIPFTIHHPQRWWPAGMGEPYTYELLAEVLGKQAKSSKRVSFGLRTITLIRQPDSTGESFYFQVNGQPLYIKGANLLPPPLLQKKTEYDNALQTMLGDCPLNLIRIWGGGVYGDDELYQYADQNGVLVWQDFMFSGTLYPADSLFLKNVEREAEEQILHLRNHPSLALWCGNNEIEVAWKNWGWTKTFHYTPADTLQLMKDYHALFQELLPNKIQFLDQGRSYLSSSPVSNWGKPLDFTRGDNHYWGVWHG